ncbi:DNA glycosylase [Trametes versicolor FP-101664 SS1]|uniref:DNA glycosylase n=1 Tax=Trametes versicolor (strain FP-101664) TaxID=717944 RepID=UPI0004621600|nr:DNA glycosylase [Trametes versicolor FP-101664 SS1]EIW63531.1 DNA glycosylase [Trametes versicolor FP-101664 SS1]
MALTRSATRNTGATPEAAQQTTAAAQTKAAASSRKRSQKSPDAEAEPAQKKPRATKAKTKAAAPTASGVKTSPAAPNTAVPTPIPNAEGEELVPAVLTFSFEEARRHLVRVDPRFEDVFRRVKCRPFEHLERVDPFRTLAHSILGQQISWKAAASITHKFVRLFDPSLPESIADSKSNFFPSAHQVITKDIATLRSAGLSGRKAEYVLDLAGRFADGRLSTRKLLLADDEELYKMLIEVRGIGRVIDMFAMFSLRRPDILPVGKSSRWDLGVQKGMLRWFVSLHSPSTHPVSLRKDKLSKEDETQAAVAGNSMGLPMGAEGEGAATMPRAATPDASSILPAPDASVEPASAPQGKGKKKADDVAPAGGSENPLPAPFTPSIAQTLNMKTTTTEDGGKYTPPPLPEGLTVAVMKNRLSGKKVKGALLTPKEMEDLAECWQPYRSLGVYYMWALAEEPK